MTTPPTAREAFLKALEADPLDSLSRSAYADWLEENGEDDEAARQRAWVDSYHLLAYYVDPYADEVDEDCPEPRPRVYSEVMAEVAFWREYVQKGDICFGSNRAQDELQIHEKKEAFWRAFEVITGVRPPEKLRTQEWYKCAC